MIADFNSLTSKQKKVYSAIESFIKLKGIPPTVRELGEMVGEKTPGAVQGILNRLEQKGVITRKVGMARSIQLVSTDSQYITPVYVPEIKKISKRNIDDLLNVYNIIKYHPLSPDCVVENSDSFIIQCPDNSFAESFIRYEDMLIISRNCEIKDEDYVLVLFENSALLRRYYSTPNHGTVTLKADSNLLGRENFERAEIIIVGKLVGKYTLFK